VTVDCTHVFAQILKDATLFFSCPSTSPTVIPAMDHINTAFTNMTLPTGKNNPAVCVAIGIAKKTLNKYYSLTDFSELYWISMDELSFVFFNCYSFGAT
jgi:hypothetical protein